MKIFALLCFPLVETVFLASSRPCFPAMLPRPSGSSPVTFVPDDRSNRNRPDDLVMHLRGGLSEIYKPRVVSVHDLHGWKNVSEDDAQYDYDYVSSKKDGRLSDLFQVSSEKGNLKESVGAKNDIPFADHQHLIDMLRENRRLLQSCKALRSRAVDDETKSSLDLRIAQLESAWNAYVKVNPTAANWQNVLLRPTDAEEENVRLVPVTFMVQCNSTKVGDEIVVSGDVEELGNWRESCAVVLRTCPETFPRWTATVLLRASECIEYKYAIRRRQGEDPAAPGILVWEGHMGNRGVKVPRRAHVIEDELIEDEQLSDNWRAPRFLRMHRVDSSELFLEPEYAMVFD